MYASECVKQFSKLENFYIKDIIILKSKMLKEIIQKHTNQKQ